MRFTMYYVLCTAFFDFVTALHTVSENGQSFSVDMGMFVSVFFGAIIVGFVYGKLTKSHFSSEHKMGATLLCVLTTLVIDAANWTLSGQFAGEGATMFMSYALIFPVIGGFVILGGLSLGSRVVNGPKPE